MLARYIALTLAAAPLLSSQLEGAIEAHSSGKAKEITDKVIQLAREPHGSVFTPPEGWMIADPAQLPASVRLMAVGKGKKDFPPSLNLASERFKGSIEDYHKIIKEINQSQGFQWKKLGKLDSPAGSLALSQADTVNEWGQVQLLHGVVLVDGVVHIVTGAALKEEFGQFRATFINAMKSLRVNPGAIAMVKDPQRRAKLEQARSTVMNKWKNTVAQAGDQPSREESKALFYKELFQSETWKPFTHMLASDYDDMEPSWQTAILDGLMNEILDDGSSKA